LEIRQGKGNHESGEFSKEEFNERERWPPGRQAAVCEKCIKGFALEKIKLILLK